MKVHFVVSLVLLLLLATAGVQTRTHVTLLERSVFPMGLATTTDNGEGFLANICTVFSINPSRHLFMSAGHCVVDDEGAVRTEGLYVGDYDVDSVILFDKEHDLAILASQQPAVALRLRGYDLQYEETLRIPSFQLGLFTFMIARGYVNNPGAQPSGFEKAYMLHSVYGCGGSSGAPVLDQYGYLVGVEQVGFRAIEPCSGLGGSALLSEVRAYKGYFS